MSTFENGTIALTSYHPKGQIDVGGTHLPGNGQKLLHDGAYVSANELILRKPLVACVTECKHFPLEDYVLKVSGVDAGFMSEAASMKANEPVHSPFIQRSLAAFESAKARSLLVIEPPIHL